MRYLTCIKIPFMTQRPINQFLTPLMMLFLLILSSCGGENTSIPNSGVDNLETPESDLTQIDTIKNEAESIPENPQIKPITPAKELYKKIKNQSVSVTFHGFGTEPFWDLYLTDDEVLYTVNEEEFKSYRLLTPFDRGAKKQRIRYENEKGKVTEVLIKKEPTSDGMSDNTYPYAVIFSEDEPFRNGAGTLK